MSVPEAAMDKYDGTVARKHKVGTTGEPPVLKSVTQAPRVESSSNEHFRLGIACPYTAHVESPLLRSKHVSHREFRQTRL